MECRPAPDARDLPKPSFRPHGSLAYPPRAEGRDVVTAEDPAGGEVYTSVGSEAGAASNLASAASSSAWVAGSAACRSNPASYSGTCAETAGAFRDPVPEESLQGSSAFPQPAGSAAAASGGLAEDMEDPSSELQVQGGDIWSLARCVRILQTSPPAEVQDFLKDVVRVLLGEERGASHMTWVGGRLSDESKAFLQSRKIGMKAVLLCYKEDFRSTGDGQKMKVSYLQSSMKASFHMSLPPV
eukprot:TRINITY_DN10278_c0_g1_i1.p1 TRINITY_DN10278_c0_g1~~TRINITY_DN10278_c0_g1_i1.p1  ORF type:complete len:242 (-),score=39.26 TRINITY_DN10278_c0_g1_i1:337-1062(-)